MPFSLFQSEGETDGDFKTRVFTTCGAWILTATDSDIPSSGPVRTMWTNFLAIRALDDVELASARSDMRFGDIHSKTWWGVVSRAWVALMDAEVVRRAALRK
jgi:hypothetical protein